MKDNDPQRKYAAFISYRHVSPDKEIARVLQFLLEYNLVKPAKSAKPRHIRPVFLDVSELPTEENLEDGILRALDNAECLYVICSPDLPKSKYCLREISYFKEKHGGSLDRVATLLVRGEPGESYPASLRTKTVPDPEDPQKTMEVEIEPLFADVRAKTLPGAIWKLLSSEYLRLACRYYRCSYDELKKRHKRNLIAFALAALAGVAGITGALTHKEHQVQNTISDAYASYANEQTLEGNELLALALCTHTECRETPAYNAALRSALVQLDYKQRGQPAAKLWQTQYFHRAFTNYYLTSTENKLVIADDNVWQIVDAHNGAVLMQLPYESAFVKGKKPSVYVMLDSRPDDQGIFRDYIILTDLETNQVVAEFPFRESTGGTPAYEVISAVENGDLMCLRDRGEYVAYFTAQGQVLTKEEYVRLGQAYADERLPELEEPYHLVKDKRKKSYVVKDDRGNALLDVGTDFQAYTTSVDHSLFACAAADVLTVYDTESWTAVNSVPLPMPGVQTVRLLPGSSYYLAGFRQGSDTISCVADWRSGQVLLTTDAVVLPADREQAFFTVKEGAISRYTYTDLAMDRRETVIAHRGDRCLFGSAGNYLLRSTTDDRLLLQTPALEVCPDERLENILLRLPEALICVDGSGETRWEQACRSSLGAMAPDGSHVAWLDSRGQLQICRTADGETLNTLPAEVLAAAGSLRQLLCSHRGVGVIGDKGALWIPTGQAAVYLGSYTGGKLFSDGLLVLESGARVGDFGLFDTETLESYPVFSENTGLWAYAPETGCLVRHVESTGNNPSLTLEILRRTKSGFTPVGQLSLPDNRVENLGLDGTGQYLSVTCAGRSRVLVLEDLSVLLDAAGELYYESDGIYALVLYGEYQYHMPMYDTQTLRQQALEALKSPVSTRALTEEEEKQYAVQ